MSGIMSALTVFSSVLNTMNDSNFKTNVDLIRSNGSLTKLLSKFVIEPVIICSKGTKQSVVFDKLLQLQVDIFSSFYFQAFKILTDVNGLDSKFAFDVLSTDNNIILDKVGGSFIGIEDYKVGSINDLFGNRKFLNISNEANNDKEDSKIYNVKNDSDNDTLRGLLQKTFNIDINLKTSDGNKTIQIPIIVKALIIVTDTKNILNMLQPNSKEKTFWYRFNEFRAGAISFKELVLCGDLIKEYKDNRIKDKDGLMEILEYRKNNSVQRGLLNANITSMGFERNYNMLLLTSDDKPYFDKHIGGNIVNEKNKQKLLSEAFSLTATIIDEDYERVNIYTRDIRGSSDIGFKVLNKRKNDSGDLGDIMKSLLLSKPMSF